MGWYSLNSTNWKLYALSLFHRQRQTFEHSSVLITGYYRRFIQDYAIIALPLTDLTKKTSNQIRWDSHCDLEFKELLCSSPISDFSRPFILRTDASDRGFGAVLTQRDDSGQEHPTTTAGNSFPESSATQRLRRSYWPSISISCLSAWSAVYNCY
jgi:hypothetical protein